MLEHFKVLLDVCEWKTFKCQNCAFSYLVTTITQICAYIHAVHCMIIGIPVCMPCNPVSAWMPGQCRALLFEKMVSRSFPRFDFSTSIFRFFILSSPCSTFSRSICVQQILQLFQLAKKLVADCHCISTFHCTIIFHFFKADWFFVLLSYFSSSNPGFVEAMGQTRYNDMKK